MMRRTGKSGVAASLVYDYLKLLPVSSLTQDDIRKLEEFIADICQKYPGDVVFMNILRDFGWNRENKCFDQDSLELLDVGGLKMALSKKSLMMLTTRQSHMGPNISPKSYAPSLLLNYLTYICTTQSSQLPPIGASSSSDHQNLRSISKSPHNGSAYMARGIRIPHSTSRDEQDESKHSHHTRHTHHHGHGHSHGHGHENMRGKHSSPHHLQNGKLVIGDDFSVASSHQAGDRSVNTVSPTPSALFFHGVCLLADISGFTRLSGAFCEQGKLGLDGLQQATNGYMGRLVEVIYQHGGDIIKFAGDAIICVFLDKKTRGSIAKGQCRTSPLAPLAAPLIADPDEDGGETPCSTQHEEDISYYSQQVANLALQCAMELREICTDQLTVHVAVSCGEMCFGVLGGYKDRWECLISGDCLMSLSQCLDDAPSRNVAVTSRVMRVLGARGVERFGAELLPSGNYRLTNKPTSLAGGVGASVASVGSSGRREGRANDSPTTVIDGLGAHVGGFFGTSLETRVDRMVPDEESKIPDSITPNIESTGDDAQLRATAAAFVLATNGDTMGMRSAMMVSTSNELEEEEEEELVDWVLQSSKPEYMRMVSSFIPLPVTLAFESGGLKYLAEIREVTTMFMKWDSYDPQLHQNLVSLQSAFYSVQSVLDEAGGFLRQFLVDDKGCVVIACWGVPTASFMNNAHRALTAAAKINQHFASIDMRCSIGITTGNVYCGNVGSEMRREYAAIGDVVNLAARLMSKAKGGVYVDEATYSRLSVRMWEMFDELKPMMVKGKPQPIQAYSYHTNREAPELHKGSKGELQEIQTTCKSYLKRALESLVRPVGRKSSAKAQTELELPPLQIVLIEGRSGSGKFSTVQWLRKQAENRELRVIHIGGLDPKDAMLEYKVTAKLFSLFIGPSVYNSAHSQQMVVMHLLHEVYGDNNDVIEKVALPAMRVAFNLTEPAPIGGGSVNSGGSSGGASPSNAANLVLKRKVPAKMIVDTVKDIFTYFLTEQAHVVVVENLHCCDDSSLKCLAALREVRASSLVVCTLLSADEIKSMDSPAVRKQPDSHAPISRQGLSAIEAKAVAAPSASHAVEGIEMFRNLLLHQPNVHYILLDNYNVTEIEAMVSSALGLEQVPLGLAQWVQQLSGGSIYWIKEILQFLKSLGPEEFANVTNLQSFGSLARQSSVHSSGTKRFSFSENPGASSSPAVNSFSQSSPAAPAGDAIKAQLELLILCRFEKLPQDDQRILKAASVIGCYFSRYVLYGVLSVALKAQLQAALKTLLKERWITKVSDLRDVELPANAGLVGGLESEYAFCHPTAWETLYELTPPGDRINMHRSIAEYYENMTADDPHLFESISAHFAHVDVSRALEYSCRASLFYLSSDEQDLQHALTLLETSCNFVSCLADLQVLQVLVGTAELVFYSDVDNIITKRADGSLVRGASDVQDATGKSSQGSKRIKSPRRTWLGCCSAAGSLSAVKANKVAPESSMISRSSALSNGSKSVRLLRKDLSRNSVNAFTQQGKERVEDRLRVLDEKLQTLWQIFEKQGKQGILQRWQRNIVEARPEEEEEEYSWRSKSYFVSARQF